MAANKSTPRTARASELAQAGTAAEPAGKANAGTPMGEVPAGAATARPTSKTAGTAKVAKPTKPTAKPTKPTAKSTKPATKATPPSAKAAKPPAKPKVAKVSGKDAADKRKKPKLVRDSYTMPADEYERIPQLKKRCLGKGIAVKKSEVLRAALATLAALSDEAVAAAISGLAPVKTGRPAKRSK
jgi:hypothetical protein